MKESNAESDIEKLVHGSLVVGILVAGLLEPTVARAEIAETESVRSAFRVELEEGGNPYRGVAVEGYVYNGLRGGSPTFVCGSRVWIRPGG